MEVQVYGYYVGRFIVMLCHVGNLVAPVLRKSSGRRQTSGACYVNIKGQQAPHRPLPNAIQN